MEAFKDEILHTKEYAFVSISTPLLSNLSMVENIALILQVHEKLSRNKAQKRAFDALHSLHLDRLAPLRYDVCSIQDIFYVQLIRAFVQKGAKIVIDQPFVFLNEQTDINFILEALDALLVPYQDVTIIDLEHQKSHYKEVSCHIQE